MLMNSRLCLRTWEVSKATTGDMLRICLPWSTRCKQGALQAQKSLLGCLAFGANFSTERQKLEQRNLNSEAAVLPTINTFVRSRVVLIAQVCQLSNQRRTAQSKVCCKSQPASDIKPAASGHNMNNRRKFRSQTSDNMD